MGAMQTVFDYYTPHGAILGPLGITTGGKGKDKNPAYATGKFDPASQQARDDITNFMRSSEDQQRNDFHASVQRGIANRKTAKEQENKAIFGPQLEATKTNVPGFLSQYAPQFASGADRGTLYGRSLENAMKEGKTSTEKMDEGIGAKGSATGLRNEAIPQFQMSQRFDPLTPAALLHEKARQDVASAGKRGGK